MIALVLLTGLGAWAGFANPVFQFPPAVLLLPLGLAWIGLRCGTARQAMRLGWFAGTLAAAGCLYWIYIPVQFYGNLPWYLALPCPLLLASALGVYYGLFSVLIQLVSRRLPPLLVMVAAGVFWASMESLIGHLLTGFPWLTLSAAFAAWPWTVQGAALIGAYGLSGVCAAVAVGLLLTPESGWALLLALVLAASAGSFGWQRTKTYEPRGRTISVGMAQADIDQSLKWDPAYQTSTVDTYIALSRKIRQETAVDLLVWPETALPFYFQDKSPLHDKVAAFVRQTGVPLVVGSPAYSPATPPAKPELYNRAYLLGPDGEAVASYDKEHLVPFGEYVPLGRWLPLGRLVEGVGDFSQGENEHALKSGDIALGLLICYEGIFPELAQKRVEEGANLLVNISNDAWFGNSSAPRQHLDLAIMRAVEQGRWLVRATNTGISMLADPLGRITARGGLFTEEALWGKVRLESDQTFFHRTYHIQAWAVHGLAALFLALALLTPARRSRRRLRQG